MMVTGAFLLPPIGSRPFATASRLAMEWSTPILVVWRPYVDELPRAALACHRAVRQ